MFCYVMWATDYTPNNVANVPIPGVTSDGRLFTDYSTESITNEKMKQQHDITSNEEYRRFLVNNSSIIIQTNYESMVTHNNTAFGNNQLTHGPPKLYTTVQDDSRCFGYEDSIPKQMYLSREQLNDKKRRLIKDEY